MYWLEKLTALGHFLHFLHYRHYRHYRHYPLAD